MRDVKKVANLIRNKDITLAKGVSAIAVHSSKITNCESVFLTMMIKLFNPLQQNMLLL